MRSEAKNTNQLDCGLRLSPGNLHKNWKISDFAVCSVSLSMVPREIAFHSQHLEKSALDSRWLTVWQKSEPILPECSTKANWHTSGKFDSIAERQSRRRKPVERLHQSLFWVHMQPINNLQPDSQTMSSSLLWQFKQLNWHNMVTTFPFWSWMFWLLCIFFA